MRPTADRCACLLTNPWPLTLIQVNALPDKSTYLEVCIALRKQQDEEIHLSQQITTQRGQLDRAQISFQKASARMKELETSSMDSNGARMLEALQEMVQTLRYTVSD